MVHRDSATVSLLIQLLADGTEVSKEEAGFYFAVGLPVLPLRALLNFVVGRARAATLFGIEGCMLQKG